MYFWVSGNHVIFVPAKSAGIDVLERHLYWLLAQQAKIIPEIMKINLIQTIDRRLSDSEIEGLREIHIINPLSELMLREASRHRNNDSYLWQMRRNRDYPKFILQALRWAGGSAAPIDVEYQTAAKSHLISADVRIKLKVSDGSKTREGVNAIMHIIRDIPDEMISFKTKGAHAYRGHLRLIKDIHIESSADSTAPNTISAWKEMSFLLHRYINSGSIER